MGISETVFDALEIPSDIACGMPKITIIGAKRAYVENYTGLIDYKPNSIKLKSKSGIIEISGSEMMILAAQDGCMGIAGKIIGAKYV